MKSCSDDVRMHSLPLELQKLTKGPEGNTNHGELRAVPWNRVGRKVPALEVEIAGQRAGLARKQTLEPYRWTFFDVSKVARHCLVPDSFVVKTQGLRSVDGGVVGVCYGCCLEID